MEPKLVYIAEKTIYGYGTRTRNENEFNPNTAKIPGIWQAFYASPVATQPEIYGVYSDYESDVHGFYNLTVGSTQPAPDLKEVNISAGDYLLFENSGSIPEVVIQTWQQIWVYFLNMDKYQRNYLTDFELYTGKDTIQIYIGVQG